MTLVKKQNLLLQSCPVQKFLEQTKIFWSYRRIKRSFLCFQGCVDEYAMCPQWSRSGYCHKESQFMYFHCRESCGSCGFKSRMLILYCVIISDRIIDNKMLKRIPFFQPWIQKIKLKTESNILIWVPGVILVSFF